MISSGDALKSLALEAALSPQEEKLEIGRKKQKLFIGIPKETREAKPFWCSVNKIPYDQMWEDDVTWFKYLIKKKYFSGKYIFEKDQMLDSKVDFKK